MRRIILVAALACVLALAGCADDPSTDDDIETTDDTGDGTDAADDAGDSTDTDDGGDDSDTDDSTNDGTDQVQTPDGELLIHHIDVGQADSTLLVAPNGETMLVDTGDWRQDGKEVLAYLDEQGIDRVDHLVATHGHADHVGGHAALIDTYETERDGVGAVYDSGVATTSQTYENYLDAVEEHEVDLFEVQDGDSLPFGEAVEVTVLNPPAERDGSDLHANAVALSVEFGDVQYLTTGDLEASDESRLVEQWGEELDADLYHAGHHGSKTSSSESFLRAVDPDAAVISSAFDSQFGHPSDETLERFAEHDIESYWTAVHGDTVFGTDGEELTADTEADASTDPTELLDIKHSGEQPRVSARQFHTSPGIVMHP